LLTRRVGYAPDAIGDPDGATRRTTPSIRPIVAGGAQLSTVGLVIAAMAPAAAHTSSHRIDNRDNTRTNGSVMLAGSIPRSSLSDAARAHAAFATI
jgi:hypothetical protein